MPAWVGALLLLVPLASWAHPGGLDADGCHTHRETGEDHCHRGDGVTKRGKKKKTRSSCDPSVWSNRAVYVDKILDGGTLEVRAGSDRTKVRVLGIDCPESHKNPKCLREGVANCEVQIPRGKQAAKRAAELLKHQVVTLEEAAKCDAFGRLLAYVRLKGGMDFGLILIREGLCADFGWKYPHSRGEAYRAAAGTPPRGVPTTAKLEVQFHNKTGHILENVRIGDRFLGTITTSTGYWSFDRIGFDGSAPDLPLTGEIDGEFIPNHSSKYFCGTEKRQVEEGTFDIDITLRDEFGERTLFLGMHR